MWQRFTLDDIRVIGHYLGTLLIFASLAMCIPLAVALICQEWEPACRYFFAIGVALVIGALLRFCRISPAHLSRRQAVAVTGLAWLVLALMASLPLYLSGHYTNYIDAIFDGVSGLTTTGASTLRDLDHLSNADNMFRFVMHFVGGLGLIVVALSLGLFGKRAGAGLYSSEARGEHVLPNVVQTTRYITKITIAFVLVATVILTAICVFIGMEPLRALLHALWLSASGFVTGGFTPMGESVAYYHNFALEVVMMILMILGSISFVLYSEVGRGRLKNFFRDIEIRTMLLWLSVMTCVFAAALSSSASFSTLPAMLRRGLFSIIACFSTSGFQTITTNQLTTILTSGSFLTLAIMMAVGGSAGSTTGGVKFFRVGIIFKSLVSSIKEALAPSSARVVVSYNHVGRHILTPELARSAMTVFVLFVITYVIGALVGIAHGYDASLALFESISMASNGGLTSGLVTPGMPVGLEVFYIFEMWAGRLEFVTFIALLVEVVVSIKPVRRIVGRK